MPSIEEGLVAHLVADVNVDAQVADRIYKEHLPQEPTFPVVAYSRGSTQRDLTLDGPTGLHRVVFTVEVMGETAAQVAAAATAVKNSLDGVTGNLGGVSVQYVYYTDEADYSTFDGDFELRIISLGLQVILN